MPTLRPATPDDAPFLKALCARFQESGLPPWRDRQKLLAFHAREAEGVVAAVCQGETVLVAEVKGRPEGFIHLRQDMDFLTGEPQAYIADVAVSAGVEGRGVGKALMAAAERWARDRKLRVLTLDVFAANARARAFYARLGFQEQTLKLAKALESRPAAR